MGSCGCAREVVLVAGLIYGGGFAIWLLVMAVVAFTIVRGAKKERKR